MNARRYVPGLELPWRPHIQDRVLPGKPYKSIYFDSRDHFPFNIQ
jgi:hypothetical protein